MRHWTPSPLITSADWSRPALRRRLTSTSSGSSTDAPIRPPRACGRCRSARQHRRRSDRHRHRGGRPGSGHRSSRGGRVGCRGFPHTADRRSPRRAAPTVPHRQRHGLGRPGPRLPTGRGPTQRERAPCRAGQRRPAVPAPQRRDDPLPVRTRGRRRLPRTIGGRGRPSSTRPRRRTRGCRPTRPCPARLAPSEPDAGPAWRPCHHHSRLPRVPGDHDGYATGDRAGGQSISAPALAGAGCWPMAPETTRLLPDTPRWSCTATGPAHSAYSCAT